MKPLWNKDEIEILKRYAGKLSVAQLAEMTNRSYDAVRIKIGSLRKSGDLPAVDVLPPSSMPKYDQPLMSQGDALILTDVEAPFQHSEFINKVLDLADAWGIKDLHLGGDLLHYDSLSKWGAEWIPDNLEANIEEIAHFINQLPQKYKKMGTELLEGKILSNGGGYSDELAEARKVFASFRMFDNIYVALGNHDDRYLKAIDQAVKPKELLVQLDKHNDKRWKIAPYYYSIVESGGETYRVEHPRNAGRTAAQDLATQYHCHIVMGHSHRWAVNRDPSGDYWAIQTGHCVDEERLAYVMQRSAKRDAHCLGATIIRDGHPWVLGEWSPFEKMKRM